MQEKGVWDLTGNGAGVPRTQATLEKAKGTALRIILESIDDNLFFGQGVVYAILNELFGYAAANKSKGYTKSDNAIFGDVGSLIKRLKSAVREDRDIWDNIHIVIVLGALAPEYDNNKAHITTSKEIQVQEVQQYMASEEVQINSDRQVGVEPELAMGMQNRGRPMAYNSLYEGRRGRGDDRICYNYGILKRYGWSYSDKDDHMLLTKETVAIRAKFTKQNIYRLVVYGGKEVIMAVQGQQGRPTHLMGATPTQHLWHRRFGHASHERIKLASTMVNGLLLHHAAESYKTANQFASDSECLTSDSEHLTNGSKLLSLDMESELLATLQADEDPPNVCIPCVQSKQTRIIQHTPMRVINRVLEQLHSDLWGPYDPESLGGSLYAVVLVDDYSKKSWVDFLMTKDGFYDWFICMIPKLERLTDQELGQASKTVDDQTAPAIDTPDTANGSKGAAAKAGNSNDTDDDVEAATAHNQEVIDRQQQQIRRVRQDIKYEENKQELERLNARRQEGPRATTMTPENNGGFTPGEYLDEINQSRELMLEQFPTKWDFIVWAATYLEKTAMSDWQRQKEQHDRAWVIYDNYLKVLEQNLSPGEDTDERNIITFNAVSGPPYNGATVRCTMYDGYNVRHTTVRQGHTC
ncbi:hypothetical protein LPUS_09079 [Lasallia pustulata]|uniref:Uncharacterized protein n=1 Tax=Lasallia pustulata TaxID=136370 RepID=A0A1W5D6S2_9LECA|nr:hypothetical protein LPUS_09079 [Lasallia pustulata]